MTELTQPQTGTQKNKRSQVQVRDVINKLSVNKLSFPHRGTDAWNKLDGKAV